MNTARPAPLAARVFAHLGRGDFRSGSDLARELGVSRSAIWKAVRALRALGMAVHAVPNRGYRLGVPTAPLDAGRIRAHLGASTRAHLRQLEAQWSLSSTNAVLSARSGLQPGRCDALLAEYQSAGRGRQGRAWLAPPGGAICLSLSWCFAQMPPDLQALGLAVGVWVLRALRQCLPQGTAGGAGPWGLKWPNDLLVAGCKLGGILIDLRAEAGGPSQVVIGIGLNAALGEQLRAQIAATGTEPADLRSQQIDPLRRNEVAARLIECIVCGLLQFEAAGLRPFIEEWRQADVLLARPVRVQTFSQITRGVARGIDGDGALLLETAQGLKRFVSGEVSVRLQP